MQKKPLTGVVGKSYQVLATKLVVLVKATFRNNLRPFNFPETLIKVLGLLGHMGSSVN